MENNEIGDIIANDKHEHEYQMIMSNRHMISGIMPDWMIRRYCRDFNMISPFEDHNLKPGVISSGLGSYTYDIRLGWSFKVFTPVYCGEVNPKNFDPNVFVEINTSNSILIPPNSFALAQSVEWFIVPRDTLILCLGKSTYARCGIVVNVTPLEPGWRGRVTIEISNTTPLPARVFSNEGIAALLFFRTLANCDRDYAQKHGIYQDQDDVEGPRVRKQ